MGIARKMRHTPEGAGLSRRRVVAAGLAGAFATALQGAAKPVLRLGCFDVSLNLAGKPEAFAVAAAIGFEGLQISLLKDTQGDRLALADPALLARVKSASGESGVPIASAALSAPYARFDEASLQWVRDAFPILRALKTQILLLAFFGVRAIQSAEERERVAGLLRDAGPEAEKAGVILGIENTLSGEDNARLLDRAASKAIRVYYDVGNSANIGGFDPAKEIRWLGKDRICEFHLKDKRYLGEGRVDVPSLLDAITEIGFHGFAHLETPAPSGSIEADMRRNLGYVRKLLEAH